MSLTTASPNSAAFHRRHRAPSPALECLFELRHVHDHAIDAVLGRSVRITSGTDTQVFRPVVRTCPLCKSDEETLIRGKAIYRSEWLVFCGAFPGDVGKD